MKKRLLSALLALSVLVGTMPVSALAETQPEPATPENAATEQEIKEITASFTVDTSDADLPDNDELFAMYLQQQMYPGSVPSTYANWGKVEGVLNSQERAIYGEIKELISKIAAGTWTTTSELGISYTQTWTYDELGITDFSDENLDDAVKKAVNESVDFGRIYDCLMADCPAEFYWYDKTIGFGWGYSISGNTVQRTVTVKYTRVEMAVAEDYRQDGDLYILNQDKVAGVQNALDKAAEIVNTYEGQSDYERLAAYKQEICELTNYNFDAAEDPNTPYGDPWQLVYVFDGDDDTTVVCEGYSKAFQYLCDLSDIDCYTVTGAMNYGEGDEPHMWNIVPMGGKNYLVDVTNCDDGAAGSPDKLFLAGASGGTVEGGYTISVGGDTISYIYDPDTLALYPESILTLAGENYDPDADEPLQETEDKTVVVKHRYTQTGDRELSVQSIIPEDAGSVTYTAQTKADEKGLVGNWSVDAQGTVSYTLTGTGSAGDVATLPVLVTSGNYKPFTVNVEVTMTEKDEPVVEVEPYTAVYTGQEVSPEDLNPKAKVGETAVDGSWAWKGKAPVNVADSGTCALVFTPTDSAAYETVEVQVLVTITKANPATPTGPFAATYGQTLADVALPEGWSWDAPDTPVGNVGQNGFAAGYAEDANHNSGSATLTVTVTAKQITPTVTVASGNVFTGQALEPRVTVQDGDTVLAQDTDYTVTYQNNTNAGEATVTVNPVDSSNYAFDEVQEKFTIAKAAAPTLPAQDKQHRYTVTGEQTVTLQNPMPDNAGTVTYAAGSKSDASGIVSDWSVGSDGTVRYTLSGQGAAGDTATLPVIVSSQNYQDATLNIRLTMLDRDVPAVSVKDYTQPYDAQPVEVADLEKDSGSVQGSWAWKNTAPVNVADSGTYTLVFTPDDQTSYAPAEATVQVTITKAPASVTAPPQAVASLVYTGRPQQLVTAGQAEGGTMQYALSQSGPFNTELPTATDAGSYTVWYMVAGDANHENFAPVELGEVSIAKAEADPELPQNLTATYGQTLADVALPEGWSWDASDTPVGDVGTHTFAATYAETGNYEAKQCDLSVTVQAKDLSDAQVSLSETLFTYNGSEQKPAVTVKLDGATLAADDYQVDFSSEAVHAGTVIVTVTGKGNYSGTATAQYVIAKKPVAAVVTAADKEYDGTTDATVTATVNTGIPGDAITITGLTGTFAQKNVGDNLEVDINCDAVQITNGDNYEVTIPGKATASITPANFTYTVEDQIVRFGNGLASIVAEPKATGVANETVAGTLAWYSDAAHENRLDQGYAFAEAAGQTLELYWIFTPAPEETNYSATPLNGNVTLTLQEKETPVVNKGTEPKTKIFDKGFLTVATVTEGVTVMDASGNTVEGTWAFKDADSTNLRNAGTYAVDLIFTPKDTQNYNTVETSIQLEIEKRELTIYLYLSTNRIAVGDKLPEAQLSYTGVAHGDGAVIYSRPLTTGMPDDSKTAGTYTVTWTDPESVSFTILNGLLENYTVVTETEAVLTITDADFLPDLEVPDKEDWERYRLERSEMKDVPENLQEQYKTVDAIRQAMYYVACEQVKGIQQANALLWDLTLWYSPHKGETWIKATEDNFPKAGITITLPYPEGTKREDYTFAVTHMLANGTVENCAVTETDNGVQFTVHSLSPILLGWRDINAPLVPPGGGSGSSAGSNAATSPAATAAPAASGDSITYYVCPACGYHNWTAAADGYHCDQCGYVESDKQLSDYGNVKGVYEPNTSGGGAAAVSSVIPQTSDESNPALWGLVAVVSVAVLGALVWFKRKNNKNK